MSMGLRLAARGKLRYKASCWEYNDFYFGIKDEGMSAAKSFPLCHLTDSFRLKRLKSLLQMFSV